MLEAILIMYVVSFIALAIGVFFEYEVVAGVSFILVLGIVLVSMALAIHDAVTDEPTVYVYLDLEDNIGLSYECKVSESEQYHYCKVEDKLIPVESYEILD